MGGGGERCTGAQPAKPQRGTRLCDGDAEQPRDARIAEHETRSADPQHARGAPVELVHAPEANGRIERHGDGARQHRAEERIHELRAGGKDDGDAVAAFDAQIAQRSRGAPRTVVHFRERQPGFALLGIEERKAPARARR